MASGKVHFFSNIITAGTTIPLFVLDPLGTIVGNICGILLTPDLDMKQTTYTERLMSNFIKKVTGIESNLIHKIILLFSLPYAQFKHRHWMTHLPPFCTIGKFLYLLIFYFIFSIFSDSFLTPNEIVNTFWLAIVIWIIHDTIHLILDGGMILVNGKYVYLFGKSFYRIMKFLTERFDNALR